MLDLPARTCAGERVVHTGNVDARKSGVTLVVLPGCVGLCMLNKFLGGVVVTAQYEQDATRKVVPGLGHALLKATYFLLLVTRTGSRLAKPLRKTTQRTERHFATE